MSLGWSRWTGNDKEAILCTCYTTCADLIADQKGLPRDKVQSWTPYAGGAACNVATAIGRMGMDVLFITSLGNDDWGNQLLELIKSECTSMQPRCCHA